MWSALAAGVDVGSSFVICDMCAWCNAWRDAGYCASGRIDSTGPPLGASVSRETCCTGLLAWCLGGGLPTPPWLAATARYLSCSTLPGRNTCSSGKLLGPLPQAISSSCMGWFNLQCLAYVSTWFCVVLRGSAMHFVVCLRIYVLYV